MSYQQFFKQAQSVSRGEKKPRPATKIAKEKAPIQRPAQLLPVRRRPSPVSYINFKGVAGLLAALGFTIFYLSAPEKVEGWLSRIEISAIGGAEASEKKAAEKSSPAAPKAEKPAAAIDNKEPAKGHAEKESVSEDLSHFEKLKQRKETLDAREKELGELEEELQRQKVELDKRIQQLEDMRNQIAQILKERVEMDQEKVNKLVELYSNMKPKQAADVIGSLNEDLAVEVLAKMKKKNAAEIMNLLPADKARVLSEKYTGYRRNHPEPKG